MPPLRYRIFLAWASSVLFPGKMPICKLDNLFCLSSEDPGRNCRTGYKAAEGCRRLARYLCVSLITLTYMLKGTNKSRL